MYIVFAPTLIKALRETHALFGIFLTNPVQEAIWWKQKTW